MSGIPRILDADSSQLLAMTGSQLAESIRLAEGRTVAAEVQCDVQPPVDAVSNGELAAAFGADLVALDRYDVTRPAIAGVALDLMEPLRAYARLLGRPVAVNLMVAGAEASLAGRAFTQANAELATLQGVTTLFVYVRPKHGGTHEQMVRQVSAVSAALGGRVMLVGVPSFLRAAPRTIANLDAFRRDIDALAKAGCMGIALPMPGSKQGWTIDLAGTLVDHTHAAGTLAWLFVTHSVEGAPQSVMSALALDAKHTGADAIRLDEAGPSGMPPPENIMAFSLALRGVRHTYRRMAASILR